MHKIPCGSRFGGGSLFDMRFFVTPEAEVSKGVVFGFGFCFVMMVGRGMMSWKERWKRKDRVREQDRMKGRQIIRKCQNLRWRTEVTRSHQHVKSSGRPQSAGRLFYFALPGSLTALIDINDQILS
jgi:hypothetical protein